MSSVAEMLQFLDLSAEDSAVFRLKQYVAMVVSGNSRVNVTGARTEEDFIAGPLFDALTLMPVLRPHISLVDIGSGGGLPAVPLAILFPSIALTLVEPRSRRAAFLRQVALELSLPLEILQTQDRELGSRRFDGASAQAVFPPPLWMKRAKKLVAPGGCIYVLGSSEITAAMLPSGCRIDLQRHWLRPMDDARRFSARIVVE